MGTPTPAVFAKRGKRSPKTSAPVAQVPAVPTWHMLPIHQPLKIAVVGFASNTRDLAPFKDGTWQIWGLNNLWTFLPRYDAWWEVHDPEQIESLYGADYVKFLKELRIPLFMQKRYPEYPASIEIPRKELAEKVQNGRDFWPSSISFMVAMAIMLMSGPDGRALPGSELALYGIDLLGPDEYSFQREGCGFLIGIAEGRGIKVTIPDAASLLKGAYVYGYEAGEYSPAQYSTFLDSQTVFYAKKKEEALAMIHTYDGAIQAFQNAKTMFHHNVRGGKLAIVNPPPPQPPAAEGVKAT
jgi:hypothetical protein